MYFLKAREFSLNEENPFIIIKSKQFAFDRHVYFPQVIVDVYLLVL